MSVRTEELGGAPSRPDPVPMVPGTWGLTWHGVRTVARLELRQRIRSTRWVISLVAFGLVVGAVTLLTWLVSDTEPGFGAGRTMFGFIVFFVLFLGLLVSPTLSATSINGDRAAGTLATLQVTLLSAAEIAVGKLLASWLASLAFLAVSAPFLLWALATGGTPAVAVVTTLVLLAVMLAVVCAIGLGFSALTTRTAGSSVLTYVAVASLSILTLVVFGLTLPLVSGEETQQVYREDWRAAEEAALESGGEYVPGPCEWFEEEVYVAHTERTWWLLAVNPFVIVADAMPGAPETDAHGGYVGEGDPMSLIRYGVRQARLGPPETQDWCYQQPVTQGSGRAELDALSPAWPWGLGANLLLAVGGVVLAVRRLRIPQDRLPQGTRVA
ncbi:ABC transporter permease [Actinotalea soli]|nr:ABC transporter permease [Actinotalea soli]